MKQHFFLFASFFFLFGLSAQEEAQVFSIEEAIDYALQNSTTSKSAQMDIDYARWQVKEYQSIGIPKVNGKVEYQHFFDIPTQIIPDFISPVVVGTLESFQLVPQGTAAGLPTGSAPAQFGVKNSFNAGITASTLVFDGSYFVGLKAAKGLSDMTARQADLDLYSLRYEVRKAYLTVLLAEENISVLQRNIDNLQNLLKETEAFYEAGLIEELDVDRLRLSYSNLESEKEIVNRQVELAYNFLKFQMGYPLQKPIRLSESLETLLQEPQEADLAGDINYNQRIEMDVLQRTEYLNELNVKRLQMGYAPSLSAFFTHQQVLQRNNLFDGDEAGFFPTTIFGATLNVPIFDGFDKRAKIKMAKIDKDRFSLQIEQFKRAMALEIANARASYSNSKKRFENQEQNLQLAQRILDRTKTKYKEGVGSSTEISQAEQELYRTQANYLNALYDLVLAKTQLDQALGL